MRLLLRGGGKGFLRRGGFGGGCGVPAAMEPAHVGQGALRAAAHGDHFRDDGDGDLCGCDCADVKTHWRMDAVKHLWLEAFAGELAKDGDGLAFGTDHADVTRGRLYSPTQGSHVVAVAAG